MFVSPRLPQAGNPSQGFIVVPVADSIVFALDQQQSAVRYIRRPRLALIWVSLPENASSRVVCRSPAHVSRVHVRCTVSVADGELCQSSVSFGRWADNSSRGCEASSG